VAAGATVDQAVSELGRGRRVAGVLDADADADADAFRLAQDS
jgi:hypothetical protein